MKRTKVISRRKYFTTLGDEKDVKIIKIGKAIILMETTFLNFNVALVEVII